MNAYDLCQRHVVTVRRHEDLCTGGLDDERTERRLPGGS